MKINTTFHIFVIFLSLLVLVMPQIAAAQEISETQQATQDARRDAELNTSLLAWGSAGFLCGCFGFAYAYLATPGVPAGVLLGKSPIYVDTYTQVYQQHVKRRRLQASIIGCAVGSAISTVYTYMFVLPE